MSHTILKLLMGCPDQVRCHALTATSHKVPKNSLDCSQGMNSMKLVIPLHSLYWSIHTKDESKREIAFAFIFGVN